MKVEKRLRIAAVLYLPFRRNQIRKYFFCLQHFQVLMRQYFFMRELNWSRLNEESINSLRLQARQFAVTPIPKVLAPSQINDVNRAPFSKTSLLRSQMAIEENGIVIIVSILSIQLSPVINFAFDQLTRYISVQTWDWTNCDNVWTDKNSNTNHDVSRVQIMCKI